MFLTTPTIDELKQLELTELVDMLARHTIDYIDLFKKEGITSTSKAMRKMINNIQLAIDSKRDAEKQSTNN